MAMANKVLSKGVMAGLISYGLWGGLGAYRGVQDYNKQYDKNYKYHLEHPTHRKPQYYYLSCLGSSAVCFGFYIMPLFLPITITMELYSLERAIRGIEDKK
jgi:hypothetical protein